jgi:hypothetical protein
VTIDRSRSRRVAGMAGLVVAVCLVEIAAAAAAQGAHRPHVRLSLRSSVIDLFQSAAVRVSGVTAQQAEVRLLGATDESGLAYEWTPYRWQQLRLVRGRWQGVLPSPALRGIYRVQLRLDHGRARVSSGTWLLRVFPHGSSTRRSFPSPLAAIRGFVAHRPGNNVLVALRHWPEASFDHRDPRLHRLFAVAYAPRGDDRVSARLGLFITTVRDGYHGRWRVLSATVQPYG